MLLFGLGNGACFSPLMEEKSLCTLPCHTIDTAIWPDKCFGNCVVSFSLFRYPE